VHRALKLGRALWPSNWPLQHFIAGFNHRQRRPAGDAVAGARKASSGQGHNSGIGRSALRCFWPSGCTPPRKSNNFIWIIFQNSACGLGQCQLLDADGGDRPQLQAFGRAHRPRHLGRSRYRPHAERRCSLLGRADNGVGGAMRLPQCAQPMHSRLVDRGQQRRTARSRRPPTPPVSPPALLRQRLAHPVDTDWQ
jgi:hypothetical protein